MIIAEMLSNYKISLLFPRFIYVFLLAVAFLAAYTPLTVYILINCPFDDIFRCTNDILSSDFNNRVIIAARLGLGRFYRDFDSSTHIRHVRTSWNVLRRV